VLKWNGAQKEVFFCQRKYVLNIITELGLLGAEPMRVHMEQNHRLAVSTSELLTDLELYCCLVGCLIYLYSTWPKLSY